MSKRLRIFLLAAACTLASGVLAARAAAPGYTLDWFTHDAGGAMHAAPVNGYALNGSIGQADAVAPIAPVNGYTLSGGFWATFDRAGVFLPVLTR